MRPPDPPPLSEWAFRRELTLPERLPPVPTNDLAFVRGAVEGAESYRLDVGADGRVTVVAEDDEGFRRAVYYYQDRVRAGDLCSCVRKPWLRNRISRCFFGPIKRPPFNRDELMDDVDYYPDAYLDRLAHEGVNGVFLTVEWRDLASTAFTPCSADAGKRLAKLRRTVEKCLRYGIRTWLFCIEPASVAADDPLYRDHPDMFGPLGWNGKHVWCPSSPKTQRYLEESARSIFSSVPGLGGLQICCHGERPTTCLSNLDAVSGEWTRPCPRCSAVAPWQVYRRTFDALMRGVRSASSQAEVLSQFYEPYVRPERADWLRETARHVPDGVTLLYNFESGAIAPQLGRYRNGGDYWLSYVGPSDAFWQVAEAGAAAQCRIGAKLQVGCSHECATVPFLPVPGLLYRKYRELHRLGVTTAVQCWYFGNYPGIMNKAAGELSFEDFRDGERAFLMRLARPYWGEDSAAVVALWDQLAKAYSEYPLSNDMQYYGPFHAGIAWPLFADVEMKPLARTWQPLDPPSGDVIGECLENHTVEEAAILARRMATGARMDAALDRLSARWKADPERIRDLNLMRAVGILFESGSDVLSFYRERARALYESRERGDVRRACASVRRMAELVERERTLTTDMLVLSRADSRLGFHSEAECHQFHPKKLEWRLEGLKRTQARLREIEDEIRRGFPYPLSPFERQAPSCAAGEWIVSDGGVRMKVSDEDSGDMRIELEMPEGLSVKIRTLDTAGVSWYRTIAIGSDLTVRPSAGYNVVTPVHEVVDVCGSRESGRARVRFVLLANAWGGDDSRRPGWIQLLQADRPVWPQDPLPVVSRLNLGACRPDRFGRIVRPSKSRSNK